jgi:hypothetical protein
LVIFHLTGGKFDRRYVGYYNKFEIGNQMVQRRHTTVTLNEILQDIHAMEEDLFVFERKYGVLSETFYESYMGGEEPADDAWVLDWSEWAGTYKILLDRQELYRQSILDLLQQETHPTISDLIARTARRESLAVAS